MSLLELAMWRLLAELVELAVRQVEAGNALEDRVARLEAVLAARGKEGKS